MWVYTDIVLIFVVENCYFLIIVFENLSSTGYIVRCVFSFQNFKIDNATVCVCVCDADLDHENNRCLVISETVQALPIKFAVKIVRLKV